MIFGNESPLSWETGERWYWSRTDPDILYCCDFYRLYRKNVRTGTLDTVIDTRTSDLDPAGTKVLWQFHTAHDGRTHSATIKDATGEPVGARGQHHLSRRRQPAPWTYIAKQGVLDECQIDKSGQYLLIKDNIDGVHGEDNLIYGPRAVAHHPGQGRRRRAQRQRLRLYGRGRQFQRAAASVVRVDVRRGRGAAAPGGLPCDGLERGAEPRLPRQCAARRAGCGQYVVGSGASRELYPRTNEIVGFRLDGSLEVLVIAPVLDGSRGARRRERGRLRAPAEGEPRRDRRVVPVDDESRGRVPRRPARPGARASARRPAAARVRGLHPRLSGALPGLALHSLGEREAEKPIQAFRVQRERSIAIIDDRLLMRFLYRITPILTDHLHDSHDSDKLIPSEPAATVLTAFRRLTENVGIPFPPLIDA